MRFAMAFFRSATVTIGAVKRALAIVLASDFAFCIVATQSATGMNLYWPQAGFAQPWSIVIIEN